MIFVVVGGALAYSRRISYVSSMPTHGDEPILALLGGPEQHDRVVGGMHSPYVLQAEDPSGGRLFFFGARHTRDPDDPQVDAIIAAWDRFDPTLALVEGRLGYGVSGFDLGVSQFGESAIVYSLARRDGVDVYSIEPEEADHARALAEATDPQAAAALLAMRFVWSNEERPYSNAALEEALRKRAVGVLAGVFADAEAFDAFWRARWFSELGDWRELDGAQFNRSPGRTELERVWAIDTELRDVHMARVLIEQVRAGAHVFAVIGRSHVAIEEPALRVLLPDATITTEFLAGSWGRW